MSKNICPRCNGESIIIDNPADTTQHLCAGCEIEMYAELHTVMNRYGIDKESAYEHLKANMAYCDADQDKSSMKELTDKHRRMANAGVYCSVCHKKVYKTDYANQKIKSKYCPNCGAVMDLDGE